MTQRLRLRANTRNIVCLQHGELIYDLSLFDVCVIAEHINTFRNVCKYVGLRESCEYTDWIGLGLEWINGHYVKLLEWQSSSCITLVSPAVPLAGLDLSERFY